VGVCWRTIASYSPRGVTIAAIETRILVRVVVHEMATTRLRTPSVALESVWRRVVQYDVEISLVTTDLRSSFYVRWIGYVPEGQTRRLPGDSRL
jgi:hypothetical protein